MCQPGVRKSDPSGGPNRDRPSASAATGHATIRRPGNTKPMNTIDRRPGRSSTPPSRSQHADEEAGALGPARTGAWLPTSPAICSRRCRPRRSDLCHRPRLSDATSTSVRSDLTLGGSFRDVPQVRRGPLTTKPPWRSRSCGSAPRSGPATRPSGCFGFDLLAPLPAASRPASAAVAVHASVDGRRMVRPPGGTPDAARIWSASPLDAAGGGREFFETPRRDHQQASVRHLGVAATVVGKSVEDPADGCDWPLPRRGDAGAHHLRPTGRVGETGGPTE